MPRSSALLVSLLLLVLSGCTAQQARDASATGSMGAIALPPGYAQLAQLQADSMAKGFEAIRVQQEVDRKAAILQRDADIAAGKTGADVTVVRAENPKMTFPEWLTGIAGLIGIAYAGYTHRRTIRNEAALVATANEIVPALAKLRAGVPLADIAYTMEDRGVPIKMGDASVIAATAPGTVLVTGKIA